MKILMKVDPDIRPEDSEDRDELAMTLFRSVKDVYNEDAGDKEAYLVEPEEEGASEELDLVDGATDPGNIIKMAENWNRNVAKDFEMALVSAISKAGDTTGFMKWLNVPSQTVYTLKKAVMALDGDFYEFAETALLVNEHNYFTTRLEDAQLADIKANPGGYASITVYPK